MKIKIPFEWVDQLELLVQISGLRKIFVPALEKGDAVSLLEVLDILYSQQEYDLFEVWKAEAKPIIDRSMEEDKEIINTGKREEYDN